MMSATSRRLVALVVFMVLAVGLVGICMPRASVQAATDPGTDGVIVQFSSKTSRAAMNSAAAGSDIKVERSVLAAPGRGVSFAVYSSDSLSTEQLMARFRNKAGVVAVSPNYVRSVDLWPDDPRLSGLWGMENTGQTGGTADADIDAAAAWDVSTGDGVVVACIDTGVDYRHEDLAANMWHNPSEIAADGIDNDGNGYVDDVYGIDSYAWDGDPMDEHGHGTHASGTIAAVGNNGLGVAGVAWRAKVMALRFLGPDGRGTDAGAVACINYAIDMKVDHGVDIVAINASWGGGGEYPQVLMNAIDAAAGAGIVFCAAAGNTGDDNDLNPYYPACCSGPNVISVGSSTPSDTRSSFSNHGLNSVDLFAPGSSVLSTYPGGYAVLSGTSMATPHVAGTVALVAALHPEDPLSTRVDRIILSVDRLPALSGLCATGGRLNAGSSVGTSRPTITSLSPASGPTTGGTPVVIRGSGFVGLSGGDAVTFGGTNATSYAVDSATQITATAPAHSPGSLSVRITSAFGSSQDTALTEFTYHIPVPAISGLAPSFGPTGGGNAVVITGTDFNGATQVLFGSVTASFEVVSDSRIEATAPSGMVGSVQVRVTTPGGTSPETPSAGYLFTDGPVIVAVAPAVGPTAGGNSVIITGGHFTGATAVVFGDAAALSFNVDSDTQITATAPLHDAGTVSLEVTGPAGVSGDTPADDYRFVGAPVVTRIDPASGPSAGGTEVLIEGSDFVGLTEATAVTFGGAAATHLTVLSENQISVTAPPGTAGPVRVRVEAVGGISPQGPAAIFTYTPASLVLYEDTDDRIGYTGSWAGFSTASASAGGYTRASTSDSSAVFTFRGDELDWIAMKGTTTGKADVYLDGRFQTTVDLAAATATYQVNVWSTGILPFGVHEVRIQRHPLNTAGKYITLDRVEVLGELIYPVPFIKSISPSAGSIAGGTLVTISGSGFNGVTSVTFGGDPATRFTVESPSKITATAPGRAAGKVRVQVTAAGGTTPDSDADDFTYATAPPVMRTDASLTNRVFMRTGTWAVFSTASAHGGSYLRSSTPGATMTIPFNGTRLDWIATRGTTTGKADFYLDNIYKTTVDLYAPAVAYQVAVWSTGTLEPGYHTVKIVRSASNVSGRYITFDAVDVAGTLLSASRKEETEPLFLWSPSFASWTTGTSTSASGGSYKYINTAGAKVTIDFTGVSLNVIARKAPSYGKMRITVDGTANYTVDLYSSTSQHKKTVWQSGVLTPGEHTVTITRLGTKNTYSSGYTIDLDAIDLIGELR